MLLLRVFLGYEFVRSGIDKLGWLSSNQLATTLKQWTTGDSPAALSSYIGFLNRFVIPHSPAYTYLIVSGELIIGSMLIIGLATRLACLPALMLSINFMLATWNKGFEWQFVNEAFIALETALLISGAGRFGGVDAPIAKAYPRCPFW